MTRFIEIPEDFALEMEGKRVGPNIFKAARTLSGRWLVAPSALESFKEDFEQLLATGWRPKTELLTAADFFEQEDEEQSEET